MAQDWRDSLKALMPDLPAGEDAQLQEETMPPQEAKSMLSIEVDKKRKGKVATIIYGFGADDDLLAVASELKRRLATGGSARDGEILVQGDRAAQVKEILSGMGYKVRK